MVYLFPVMWLGFCKLHKHQWPRIPLPTLMFHSGPLIPKLSTKPHVLVHSAEAFWESIANGAWGEHYLGWKEGTVSWGMWSHQPTRSKSSVRLPTSEKNKVSHVWWVRPQSNSVCSQTVLSFLMKTVPLAFFLSPLPAWGVGGGAWQPWAHDYCCLHPSISLSSFPKKPATLPAMFFSQQRPRACHFM